MRCAVFAYHEIGTVGLEALLESGAEVLALWTHEDDPKEEIWFRRPAEIARSRGIPVLTPADPNGPETIERLRQLRPEFLFSFYYRFLLGESILSIPPRGALNLHGSLLPKYRGRAPINWALVNGEAETGVTLHYMTKHADAGDIVAQERVPIEFEDTALTLARKMAGAATKLLRAALPLLASGRAPRVPQDDQAASKFRGRKPEDGRIDWNQSALAVYNLIRAVTHPYPGAFTTFRGQKLYLWWGIPQPASPDDPKPGAIRRESEGFVIGAREGTLRVERCQLDGQEEMRAEEFWTRERASDGEVCER